MPMLTSDIMPIVLGRVPADVLAQDGSALRRRAIMSAAYELWCDEMKAYETLRDLGFRDAAESAWERRTAACEAYCVLLAAS